MSCSYAAPGSRKKINTPNSAITSPDDMQNRIDRLEGLVLSLMTNGAHSAGPTAAARALSLSATSDSQEYSYNTADQDDDMIKDEDDEGESDTEQVAKSLGILKVDSNRATYVGDAHWAAVLSDVSMTYFVNSSSKLRFVRSRKSRIGSQNTRSNTRTSC